MLGLLGRRAREGFGGMGWGQVMGSLGCHVESSRLTEEQWNGWSKKGACEEKKGPAGQGGKHVHQLLVTNAECPGDAKEGWGTHGLDGDKSIPETSSVNLPSAFWTGAWFLITFTHLMSKKPAQMFYHCFVFLFNLSASVMFWNLGIFP